MVVSVLDGGRFCGGLCLWVLVSSIMACGGEWCGLVVFLVIVIGMKPDERPGCTAAVANMG